MFPCPWCKKKPSELVRECPSCHADLSLVVDYYLGIAGTVSEAERSTREGKLAEAVWAYLDVLDIDPDNAEARRQVGLVASAVRNFDSRPRRRPAEEWGRGIWLVIVLAVLVLGFALGMQAERWFMQGTVPAQKTEEGE